MVRTANCGDSKASSLGNDAPSVCTVLNRGEEFPRLETEIVGLGEVTTVGFAGGDGEAGESSSRRVGRRSARRFSLFHWFRRTEDCDREVHKSRGNKARKQRATNCSSTGQSVNLPIDGAAAVDVAATTNTSHTSIYSSSGSVDTNCSTATVHSFTFRLGGETDVSENKLSSLKNRHLSRLRNFRKHSSAEEFGAGERSGSPFDSEASLSHRGAPGEPEAVRVSGEESPIVGDKGGSQRTERKLQSAYYGYRSLPTLGKTADLPCSGKNKAHVRGKRRAPKPPSFEESKTFPEVGNSSGTIRGSHTGRKKRRAPEPPGGNKENGEPIRASSSLVTKTCYPKPKPTEPSSDAATPRANSIAKSEAGKEQKEGSCEPEPLSMSKTSHRRATNHVSKERSVISNDTLKLEGGVLLSAKSSAAQLVQESRAMSHVFHEASVGTKKSQLVGGHTPHAAPRPWYKRSNTTLSERDCGSFRRDVLKIPTLAKQRDKRDAGRFSLHQEAQNSVPEPSGDVVWSDRSFSRLNQFFGRTTERRDDCKTKKDEKRKSNLSILTNISELDREAAAIVQEEQVRTQAIMARSSSSFQSADAAGPPNSDIISELVSSSIEPQRRGTRALISKFNAIGNITKVTVNATFFTKSGGNQSGKIESTKASSRSGCNRNDRIVTKRLLYDGAEQVNETGDISSINFFRRLEAAEANQAKDEAVEVRAGRSSTGWEEKIKRYFPERTSGESQKLVAGSRENRKTQEPGKEAAGANSNKQRQSRGDRSSRVDTEFEFFDDRSAKRVNEKANADRTVLPSTVEQHLSRADLKEMLIEMKHSLPKRPKPKSTAKSISATSSDPQALSASKTQRLTEKSSPSGSIDLQKTAGTSALNHQSKPEARSSPALAKPRQQQVEDSGLAQQEKTKVSSGVQTSANLRKVEIPSREPKTAQLATELNQHSKNGWKREDTIYTTTGRKNAAAAGLTRNTFQLIRPRDFACIEALKTEKGSARESGQNTYMNVIEDSIYANTVIYPPKGTAENSAEEGKTKTPADDHTKKNHITDTPETETVRHYTANVVADVRIREAEPKSEIIPPSASVRTTEDDRDTKNSETNMNTVAINRLLRKLEGAIASGQHQQAAGLAKELAQLKIHCSVVRQRSGNTKASDIINVDMYIEDKLAHQGPIPLQLSLNTSVADLKKKIFAEFEIPENVQRWIIGKNLAENDEFTLNELKAVDKSSIFLYLVAPDLQNDECTRVDKVVVTKVATAIEATVEEQPREIAPIVEGEPEPEPEPKSEPEILPQEPTVEELKLKRYEHLMSLENSDLIPNSVPIECPICFAPYGPCEGVILRDCLHMFCRTCIANTIMYCEEAEVKCPFRDSEYTCESTLQEREIKALVTPEIYEQHLAKSVSQAENSAGNNAFHCKTPDCPGWCIYDDNVNVFLCPVCGVNNCLTCQAIHTNKNCREYQDEIRLLKETDQETKRTAAVLEEMVESGEALACPTCAVVLMKKWGCDWLRCSMCKTEICWVTRGPRWGPAGKGDTSGGCKCGENGVKCHPRCNYCH